MILNINYKKVVSMILAICGAYGITCELWILSQSSNLFGEIFVLPCVYFLYCTYMNCLEVRRNRKSFYLLNIILSILFSCFLILGAQLDILTDFELSLFEGVAVILCMACAICPILFKLTLYLDECNNEQKGVEAEPNRKIAIICMVIIAVIWFLAYLAMFPGVYCTDAPYWHFEFSRQDIPISSQWSVVYSGLFYWFVEFGYQCFGSYEIGFSILSFIQMSCILWTVWNVLDFLRRTFYNKAVILGAGFFIFIPSHVVLAVSSVQDALFSAFFALCLIQLFDTAKYGSAYLKRKRNYIKLVINLILLCMIRNNGLYAIILLGAFVVFWVKQCRVQMISILGMAIAVVMIYQGPFYDAIGVQKGTDVREMLSMPLQQMAYVYNFEMDKLPDDIREEMLEFVSDEGWRSYQWCISDQVKNRLNSDYTRNNFIKFLMLYFKAGAKAPVGYLKGGFLQSLGLWYPNKVYPDYRIWHPYLNYICYETKGMYEDNFTINRESKLPLYEKLLARLFGKGDDRSAYGGNLTADFSKIPIISVLIKAGIYSWAIIYISGYLLYRKWRKPFIVIGFVIGIWITVLLSPVILYRYMAPIIFSAPIFVATVFGKWDECRVSD